MKARNRKQTQMLKELENNPLIERACKKIGIARSTYYRWCEQDIFFSEKATVAQDKGRAKLNDFAESKLLENIGNNYQPAIAFWLSHNTARYRQATRQFQAYQMENMKQELWGKIDILNRLMDSIGFDRLIKLLEKTDYQELLDEIDQAYEADQIQRGKRGNRGYKPPDIHRIPYPDDMNFDPS